MQAAREESAWLIAVRNTLRSDSGGVRPCRGGIVRGHYAEPAL